VPEQQGWPLPPQAQVPAAQVRFAPHVLPLQQGWPSPPQAVQEALLHK
jgi:hypothetical protein